MSPSSTCSFCLTKTRLRVLRPDELINCVYKEYKQIDVYIMYEDKFSLFWICPPFIRTSKSHSPVSVGSSLRHVFTRPPVVHVKLLVQMVILHGIPAVQTSVNRSMNDKTTGKWQVIQYIITTSLNIYFYI